MRVERALAASQPMWQRTVRPGDDLDLDEHKSRSALDEWLDQPLGDEADAQQVLLAYLRGG